MLRKYETPYMADWFAISLRWIMLVGLDRLSWAWGQAGIIHIMASGSVDRLEFGDDRAGRLERAHAVSPPHQHGCGP